MIVSPDLVACGGESHPRRNQVVDLLEHMPLSRDKIMTTNLTFGIPTAIPSLEFDHLRQIDMTSIRIHDLPISIRKLEIETMDDGTVRIA